MSPRPSIENGRAASAVGNRSCGKQCRARLVDDEMEPANNGISKDSSQRKSTDLYRSVKRFSHTDHNWCEEHPENVIHKKSSLKIQKEKCIHI